MPTKHKDPLQGALDVCCMKAAPKETRRDLVVRLSKAMTRPLPKYGVNDWRGWPGTVVLATAVLDELGYPQDGT